MSKIYRDNHLTDRRLRRKLDETVDDPDYYTNQWDPGSFLGTVASIAAGSLTVAVTPEIEDGKPGGGPTPDPIVVTITTETDAEAAEAVVDAVNTELEDSASPWRRYLDRAEYTATATAARFVPALDAPKFTVTLTPAGGATFTLSPQDVFPITTWSAKHVGQNTGAPGVVAISVHAIDSADDMLGIGTCTFNIDVLRVYERVDSVTGRTLRPGVAIVGTATGQSLGEELRVNLGGGRFGVRISTDANVPAGTDAFEVRWRDVVS